MSFEIIAGTPPGGGQDRAARALAAAIGGRVTNFPGRGGSVAWEHLAGLPPAGDVVAISSPTLLTNAIHRISPLDHTGLTPLGRLCREGLVFAVAIASPIDTPAALADALASGLVAAVATSRGNVNHAAVALVAAARGAVPAPVRDFGSARQAVADVIADNSGVAVVSAASVLPDLASVRVVAVSAPTRLPAPLDHASTWLEAGVDCALVTWRGVVGPPTLRAGQVERWDEILAAAVASASWKEALAANLWTADHRPASEERRLLDAEYATLRRSLTSLEVAGG